MGKKYYYLKNDNELEAFKKKYPNKNLIINRFKGLGELSPEETEEVLINPENRILHQVTVSDIEETNKLFDDLMGGAVAPRKLYIQEHSKEATYNAE